MILRFLNVQGVAGLTASPALLGLLLIQKVETRHWRNHSGRLEQLYRGEQAAFARTVADYRATAEAARLADRAAADRAAAEQRAISERTNDAYQDRLADARARAERLRLETPTTPADPHRGGATAMPRLPAAAGGPDQATGQDGLPREDRLTATEQAIQLDELIKWIKEQASVDPKANSSR
jgi:hypothetical protein